MKKNWLMTLALFSRVAAATPAYSQVLPPARLDPVLMTYFAGDWSGKGAFAQGRQIAAELSFQPSLDSAWLVYEHRDLSPGRYKATSMWGVDARTGQFVAYTFDNFQGHRHWLSNGWADGRLILSTRSYRSVGGTNRASTLNRVGSFDRGGNVESCGKLDSGGNMDPGKRSGELFFEHFIYERLSDNQFKMIYETSLDGINWQLVDWLVFTRKTHRAGEAKVKSLSRAS
jgi:hypothetical protein